MSVEEFINSLLTVQIWDIAKIFVALVFLLYIVFAFVVIKQVSVMTETLNQLEFPLKAIATLHLIIAIFVFLLAMIIL